ncbi:MAG: EscU/YscU/HrcU family type III secretion system export apparatus switch protein [Alphaproteobacteria bacterium]|nr:EscU/YscU/HrcU family type III secretion system export apparatus switch protein [Alphaproteobacteria bacterium]
MNEYQEPEPPVAPLKSASGRSVAVAIKGQDGNPDSLPKIIASGRGKLAEQILELAFAKGVKVREDADLAELLVKLDLDTPIPSEAIVAVAEILAKVYEANARMAAAPAGDSIL